jgi:hypothetical protein
MISKKYLDTSSLKNCPGVGITVGTSVFPRSRSSKIKIPIKNKDPNVNEKSAINRTNGIITWGLNCSRGVNIINNYNI